MHSFVIYIDESGDDGIGNPKNIGAPGQSHWLTIGACIVSGKTDKLLPSYRDNITQAFSNSRKKDLHFQNLNHDQRLFACREVVKIPMRVVAVMSNKTTIPNHSRQDLFRKKNTLYWYLCRYMIERVSRFCARRVNRMDHGNSLSKIVFSRRGGLQYNDFQDYLTRLKEQQLSGDKRVNINWDVIDIDSVKAIDHSNCAGTQIADIVASAFNRSVEPDIYGGFEPGYAKIFSDRVYRSADGYCLNHGIKPVPDLKSMNLDPKQLEIFNFYKGRKKADP